jgi:hypothetical protein
MYRLITLLLIACSAQNLAGEVTFSPPDVPRTAIISELTPGATIVWFGVSQRPMGFTSQIERTAVLLTDTDRDGTITYVPEQGIPPRSVWAAVDLATGLFATGTPERFPRQPQPLLEGNFTGAPGQLQKVTCRTAFSEFLLVRPGTGAWTLTAADGGPGDEDRRPNNSILHGLDLVTPVGTTGPPPKQFQREDTVVVIDAYELQLLAAQLSKVK